MKVYDYTDGIKRVHLHITHRLAGRDFVSFLCFKHRDADDHGVEQLPDYSRTAILDIVRQQLAQNADAPNWWGDEAEDGWAGELQAWAEDLIRQRFPELY